MISLLSRRRASQRCFYPVPRCKTLLILCAAPRLTNRPRLYEVARERTLLWIRPSFSPALSTRRSRSECLRHKVRPRIRESVPGLLPPAVYEMVQEKGASRSKINPSNCVHCKTCDIADPYEIIRWSHRRAAVDPTMKECSRRSWIDANAKIRPIEYGERYLQGRIASVLQIRLH